MRDAGRGKIEIFISNSPCTILPREPLLSSMQKVVTQLAMASGFELQIFTPLVPAVIV
jgi:hypothetical protein